MQIFRFCPTACLFGVLSMAALPLDVAAQEEDEDRIASMVRNEDTYLELRGELAKLGRGLRAGDGLPAPGTISWTEDAQVVGLAAGDWMAGLEEPEAALLGAALAGLEAPLEDEGWPHHQHPGPWASLIDHLGSFEDASFSVEEGKWEVDAAGGERYRAEVLFEGRARRSADRAVIGMEARQTVFWRPDEEGGWAIQEWIQREMNLTRAPAPWFADATASLFADVQTMTVAQRSRHEEVVLQSLRTGQMTLPHARWQYYFQPDASNHFDGISVVDIDGDGVPEIFIPAHHGRTLLLKRQEDGTWEDIAEEVGLAFSNEVISALFFDKNNSGLPDVFLCRWLEPAMLLRNEGGRFVDVTAESTGVGSIVFAVSAAAADWNGNGLLDLVVATYGPEDSDRPGARWEEEFLTPGEVERLRPAQAKSRRYTFRAGPANAFLRNDGGRFTRVEVEGAADQWHNTHQVAFADFDGDGKPDLYLCNDFAPDTLLRNVTPRGAAKPVFVDVSESVLGPTRQGFGMGVSWADFNGNGLLDLYVTNMFSKAGRRVMGQLGDATEASRLSAEGCFLYRNEGDGVLTQVAGTEEGTLPVAAVGWAYSGQFADFTNDGFPDIYVPSGFFSVPDEADTALDL